MKKTSFFVLCMFLSPAFAITCATKIDATLCQKMASLTNTSLVSIEILLPEPPFNYPNKDSASPDSLKNYSLMVQDSLSRHLKAIEPQIDSLFAKYVLLSVTKGQRISPPNIPYDYFFDVETSVATINQLVQENLVAKLNFLSAPGVPTTVPNFTILATPFPFDTVFAGLVHVHSNSSIVLGDSGNLIIIARYGMKFYFGQLSSPIGVFGYTPIEGDFWLSSSGSYSDIRFPHDTTFLMTGRNYDSPPPPASYVNIDSSYKTHEYRFSLGDTLGHVLYMKVMGGSTLDSIRVLLDTISFLAKASVSLHPVVTNSEKIALVFDNNFLTVHGIVNGRITIYDVSGKRLFSSILNAKNARLPMQVLSGARVFIVRVMTAGQEYVVKKCIVN